MIIIVEGIDRVGKTTLCNMLKDKLNIAIYKKDRVTIDASNKDIALINLGDAIGAIDFWNSCCKYDSFIIDRFYWTEFVYTKIERYPDIPRRNLDIIEERLLRRRDNYIIVYVKATDVKRSSVEHGRNLEPHQNEFDSIFSNSKLNILTTNFNHLSETCDTIISSMKESEKQHNENSI